MIWKNKITAAVTATLLLGASATVTNAAEVDLLRFFGDCENEYGSETDLSKAVGECGIITVMVNKFNAENTIGAKVNVQTADWGGFYNQLSATYAAGDVPDISVMHRSVLPNYAARDLLTPLGTELTAAGVDTGDWLAAAKDGISYGDEIFGIPFDIHSIMLHVNMDLMAKAGLLDANGALILPTSPEELLAQGKQFKEATGLTYMGLESNSTGPMPIRVFNSWMWQQGIDPVTAEGGVNLDSPEGLKAATLLQDMYAAGLSDSSQDYGTSQQAFLNGEIGMLINGTWAVDSYNAQAASGKPGLQNYQVANFPTLFDTPAVWGDSHLWVMPKDENRDPEVQAAAVAFLAFLNENNFDWSRTGHLTVRQSVLESDAYAALPHRSEYAETASMARNLPSIQNQWAVQDEMVSEMTAIWLADVDPKAALERMQSRVEKVLSRVRN